ncbi:LysR substrate-binding domain-containing protein [Comamonas sp. MYb69]|uniref:LysR substrate-binding domain-containing protein n=1 Tax=Comamonas sp. MYb69 TaxID=1848650 RepID=UPI0030B1EB83
MKRDCPTIQELLALDAVARHSSLTLAASSLCVTTSAVSKQIASLEGFLATALLQKLGRGVELTPVGRSYWLKITGSLRSLETATYEVRAGADTNVLTLSCVPTFFTRWLIPRLPRFRQAHPRATLSFSRHLAPLENLPAHVDAAIRYNPADYAGVVNEYIAGREFVVIASSALMQGLHKIQDPADVLAHTLLHHEEAQGAWSQWAAAHGITHQLLIAGPRFAQYSALIQAARCGLGIAFVPLILVEDELAEGVLVTPFEGATAVEHGHYLCYRPDRMQSPAFAQLRQWLLTEGGSQEAVPSLPGHP